VLIFSGVKSDMSPLVVPVDVVASFKVFTLSVQWFNFVVSST